MRLKLVSALLRAATTATSECLLRNANDMRDIFAWLSVTSGGRPVGDGTVVKPEGIGTPPTHYFYESQLGVNNRKGIWKCAYSKGGKREGRTGD